MPDERVTIELSEPAGGSSSRTGTAVAGVASGLNALRDALAVPGAAAVGAQLEPRSEETDLFPATLRIDEHRLPFGHHALAWAMSVATGDWAPPNSQAEVDARLAELDEAALHDTMYHATWAIVSRQPAILLGSRELTALAAECGCADTPRLHALARGLLDLRLSLAERDALREGVESSEQSSIGAFESLVAALRPPHLKILIEPELLRRLSLASDDEHGRGMFQLARDALLTELGIQLPAIRLQPASDLPRGFAVFEYNHLRTEPVRVPWPEESVVAGDPQQADDDAVLTRNIAGNRPAYVVPVHAAPAALVQSGFAWSGLEYVILALAHMTRRHAFVLMDVAAASERLGVLRADFPELARVLSATCPLPQFASLLRSLLRSRVSIVDLVAIAQAICDRPDDAEALVRRRLAPMATSRLAMETNAVVAYLLAADLETSLSMTPRAPELPPAEPATSALRRALAQELRGVAATSAFPCVLTQDATRSVAAAALRASHPDLLVTSYGELPSWINVYPVSRLTAGIPAPG